MNLKISLDTKKIEESLNKLKTDSEKNLVLQKIDLLCDDVADIWFEDSQILCPKDTGELQGSADIKSEFLHKEVTYHTPIAVYMEYGTDAHMPPVEPLISWARRHGMKDPESAGWAIAMKIKKEGVEPHPFMRPAVDRGVAYFNSHIEGILE